MNEDIWITHSKQSATKSIKEKNSVLIFEGDVIAQAQIQTGITSCVIREDVNWGLCLLTDIISSAQLPWQRHWVSFETSRGSKMLPRGWQMWDKASRRSFWPGSWRQVGPQSLSSGIRHLGTGLCQWILKFHFDKDYREDKVPALGIATIGKKAKKPHENVNLNSSKFCLKFAPLKSLGLGLP